MTSSNGDSLSDQINMVGEGTVFEGTLRAESNVRVSGRIKGTLHVDGRAIITQEGAVEGELRSTDADIAGSVQGEIHVAERLMLKSTARIDGSIETGRIKVEEGALFTGQCDIGENVEQEVRDHIEQQGWTEEEEEEASASGGRASGGASESRSSSSSKDSSKDSSKGGPKGGPSNSSASASSLRSGGTPSAPGPSTEETTPPPKEEKTTAGK